MVRLALSALAILASTCLVAASPTSVNLDGTTPGNAIRNKPFSYEDWVNDIIANPDTALTPEQAIQAHDASEAEGEGSLNKRAECRDDSGTYKHAYVRSTPLNIPWTCFFN